MIQVMASLHISESELARDLHAVLQRVRQGIEVVVDDRQPVIVMTQPTPRRAIAEVLALIPKDSPGADGCELRAGYRSGRRSSPRTAGYIGSGNVNYMHLRKPAIVAQSGKAEYR
jgi:hypothetical protein